MFCTALLTGLALPTAGMLLQTLFKNPLAGLSVTGVSAFSALAITLFISITSASGWRNWENSSCWLIFFAFFGALSALLILSIFVRYVSNPMALIIAGFMFSALVGAIVSSLERFSPSEQIKAYMGWTMGSFSGLNFGQLAIFALFVFLGLLVVLFLLKPMNVLLLGENQAETLGIDLAQLRIIIVLTASLLTAVSSVFIGSIFFCRDDHSLPGKNAF